MRECVDEEQEDGDDVVSGDDIDDGEDGESKEGSRKTEFR